jgi:hypothetical protein
MDAAMAGNNPISQQMGGDIEQPIPFTGKHRKSHLSLPGVSASRASL